MVTIKMIAKKCGFSAATVSKALNGAPDISAETAETIRNIAAEMGYMPNSAARMLKTSRSYFFGVLFEDASNKGLTHVFFSQILNSFKHRAEELGYDICFISDRMGGREISYVEHARYRNCDGVIIASVDYTEHAVTDLANSGIPTVAIDYEFTSCGSIQSDNLGGMEALVRYIHSMGHRKIAYIHGEDTAVTRNRVASFCRTCAALGLEIPESYLIPSIYTNPDLSALYTKQLLELPDPPTCILYPDDISYIGGMNQIEKMGLSIPEDISVAGYDGADVSQMLRPRLTTLKQDAVRMGELAAEELARAVEEGRTYIPGRIVVPGELILGGTVKNLAP
ncbi:MAG: LacI family DNA-binding transcriptional regulator [Oscillospiraceae bacterium]|nr:LacI family DNA-binding transcriptional regulator [Oscillospiraceae bacterium]